MRLLVASSDFQTEDFDLGCDFIEAPTDEENSLDALISSSEMLEHGTTRRIARTTTIRENVGDETARVRLALMHQRRRPGGATSGNEWVDADSFKLSSLRADEQVKLDLGPNQTKKLFVALAKRFHELGTLQEVLAELGIRAVDEDEFTVRGREREVLARLLEEDHEFWEHLEYLQPDLLTVVALNKQHEMRKQALAIFF